MPRVGRAARGGVVYHVLNRRSGRMRLFQKEGDYEAFIDAIWAVPRGLELLKTPIEAATPGLWALGKEGRRGRLSNDASPRRSDAACGPKARRP